MSAYSYDCATNCSQAAMHTVWTPCPTMRKPFRNCANAGYDPADKGVCEVAREASCKIWNGAVSYASSKVKPILQGRFNHGAWMQAAETGHTADYDTQCQAAGVAACAALGAELGGPWGAGLSGSIGLFVSTRICEQSKAW